MPRLKRSSETKEAWIPANAADRGFPRPAKTLLFDEHAALHLTLDEERIDLRSAVVDGDVLRD